VIGNQVLGRESFLGESNINIPPNTYSAALARGLPSKGEMRRASIHEQYDVETGESASRTGDYGTGGTDGRLGKAKRTGTSGTGGTSGRLGKARKAETGETGETSGTSETSETSGTGGSASQSQRMHGAGYVGAIVRRVRQVGRVRVRAKASECMELGMWGRLWDRWDR